MTVQQVFTRGKAFLELKNPTSGKKKEVDKKVMRSEDLLEFKEWELEIRRMCLDCENINRSNLEELRKTSAARKR